MSTFFGQILFGYTNLLFSHFSMISIIVTKQLLLTIFKCNNIKESGEFMKHSVVSVLLIAN